MVSICHLDLVSRIIFSTGSSNQGKTFYKKECHICSNTIKVIAAFEQKEKSLLKMLNKLNISEKQFQALKDAENCNPELVVKMCDYLGIKGQFEKCSKLKSNNCSDCCQLVGHPVNCRNFSYKGKTYDYIPKEMILEAIKISSKSNH